MKQLRWLQTCALLVTFAVSLSYRAGADPFSLNAQAFHPAFIGATYNTTSQRPSIASLASLEGTETGRAAWTFGAQSTLDFADRPLPLLYQPGDRREVLGHLLTLHTGAWLNVSRHIAIAVSFPVVLLQDKDFFQTMSYPNVFPGTMGAGDLHLAMKWTVLDHQTAGFGVALIPRIGFPTGDGNQFRGTDAFVFSPQVAIDYLFAKTGLLLAMNLGFSFYTSSQTVSSTLIEASPHTILSHQITYGLGAALPLTHGFSILTELSGATSLINADGNIQSPLALYVGARWSHSSGVTVGCIGGPGLTTAVGNAFFRLLWTVNYTFPSKVK